jgi:ferritin-like metal-binding protein YciE
MKFLVERLKNLRELHLNRLQTLLSVQEQIATFSLDMIERTTNQGLRGTLQIHKDETEKQVLRLERVLTSATGSARQIKCKAADTLTAKTEDVLLDAHNDRVRDVALIAAAQRIERFEIAAYGAPQPFADILGDCSAAALLNQTINEKCNPDHLPTANTGHLNLEAKLAA